VPMPAPAAADRLFDEQPRVTVQLLAGQGACWTSEFSATNQNRSDFYKSKSP
jgi:hypothetical protein